ncbi:SDR family NAD(P)-dependent oxidoreductase [Amycolatopsis taiwanensis]|uniref:SDR family NAD(P)-dependent oxidoreductase n=1 Tax=Amycolatopsis taiwanensis TaxID=342230 RepID=UPI0004B27098|nr:SDR family oxidoreductase [Amycolatopsis taiwanensis]
MTGHEGDQNRNRARAGDGTTDPAGAEVRRSEPRRYSRRRLLATSAASAGVAVLTGGVAGVALTQGTAPTPTIAPSGRMRFRDKVVLVTGATSGIGRAAAIQFAAEGGKVGFCGRRQELGRQVEQHIRQSGGEATYIPADVRAESDVQRFVDTVADRYGGLDVCFNNAGITIQKPVADYTAQEWEDVNNTNLRGNFFALKYEIPHLIARGGGVIVVTASTNAVITGPGKGAYAASKHGIIGLVQSAAHDYGKDHNIRVNALLPGTTDTELVRRVAGVENLPASVWQPMKAVFAKQHIPDVPRMAQPEEIAAAALILASDDLPFMTAAQLTVDGGMTAFAS